jgi:hypothetical protein
MLEIICLSNSGEISQSDNSIDILEIRPINLKQNFTFKNIAFTGAIFKSQSLNQKSDIVTRIYMTLTL